MSVHENKEVPDGMFIVNEKEKLTEEQKVRIEEAVKQSIEKNDPQILVDSVLSEIKTR